MIASLWLSASEANPAEITSADVKGSRLGQESEAVDSEMGGRHRGLTEQCFVDSKFRHAPQPPYSPDISPCDFFLFGDLKTKLRGEEFEGVGALQARVEELLGQVTPDLMRRVYKHWIERLKQVISTNGDYV
jgi:hypothetical protein